MKNADIVKMIRTASRKDGVFGTLAINNMPIAVTLERPWLDNRKGESCIPSGSYICRRVQSPKFGDTFEITNVAGRSYILFHTGNIDDDSHGCVILGESFNVWGDGSCSVASSRIAFTEFMQFLSEVDSFTLFIEDAY